MPLLIVTVGLPKSGKTTWARRMPYPVVQLAAVRWAVTGEDNLIWSAEDLVKPTAKVMIRSLFRAGHTAVVVDADCETLLRRHRQEWRCDEEWATVFKVMEADVCECLEKAESPEVVEFISRLASQQEPLDLDEQEFVGDLAILEVS